MERGWGRGKKMNLEETKYLLNKYNLRPRREGGQNFLINDNIIKSIIKAAGLQPDDTVLEIGPGLGAITGELCKKAGKVIAVEQDRDLIKLLNNLKSVNKNLEIVNSDIFKVNLNEFVKDKEYKLVSNLPFNISSLVLRNFLQFKPRPKEIILLLQKEVAERAAAGPGKMSVLSVATQFFGEAELLDIVEEDDFYPAPVIKGRIIKIIYKEPEVDNIEGFFKFVRAGFSARRKKLVNNLANGLKLDKKEVEERIKKVDLDEKIRAQDLTVEKWVELFDLFS